MIISPFFQFEWEFKKKKKLPLKKIFYFAFWKVVFLSLWILWKNIVCLWTKIFIFWIEVIIINLDLGCLYVKNECIVIVRLVLTNKQKYSQWVADYISISRMFIDEREFYISDRRWTDKYILRTWQNCNRTLK